jgi:hypothetical protein
VAMTDKMPGAGNLGKPPQKIPKNCFAETMSVKTRRAEKLLKFQESPFSSQAFLRESPPESPVSGNRRTLPKQSSTEGTIPLRRVVERDDLLLILDPQNQPLSSNEY